MKTLKGILGYSWAFLTIFIVLATFMGNDYFSEQLASATGITVSPWFSGGEVVRTVDHGTYKTYLHRPVFDALIGEKRKGFMQLNWEPYEGLPSMIREQIDYNGDNKKDFLITVDTHTGDTTLTAQNPTVLATEGPYRLKKGWAVRVRLKK